MFGYQEGATKVPGIYDIVVTTTDGVGSARGAFVVLPNPAPINASTPTSIATPAAPVLIASPGATVALPYDVSLLQFLNDTIVALTVLASVWVARKTVNMPVVDALAHT